MSSLTAQESSESNPSNPVNKGTTSAPGTGSDTAVPSATGSQSESGFGGVGNKVCSESQTLSLVQVQVQVQVHHSSAHALVEEVFEGK